MSQKCHVWTAPALQEKNLTSERSVRVQPCIRPFDAAALAAGPDVIRWSGRNQKHALFPRVALHGFRLTVSSTSSSPLQFHEFTNATSSPIARPGLHAPPDEAPARFYLRLISELAC